MFSNFNALFTGTWVLFLSLFMMMAGNGLQSSLLSIRGGSEGFSTISLALISTVFYVGYFLGSWGVPTLLQRVGYIRVFAILVAVASVAAVIYAMFVNLSVWLLMRMMTGFCFAGIYMVAESWLNSQTHNDNRAKVLGMYFVVLFLGLSMGQFLLNFGDISGYYLFALASVIISLASVPLLLTNRPTPVVDESVESLSLRQFYKRSPLGAVSAFFANIINGTMLGMAAIYAISQNMATDEIALFVSSAFIGVICLQFPIGYLSDRLDRRKVIIGLSVATVVLSMYTMTVTDTHVLIVLFGVLGGIGLPLYSVAIAYVNDRLQPEEVLPATSALLKISGLANMISPLLVGFLMVEYGSQWFFGTMGVSSGVIVIFGLYRLTRRDDVDIEDMADFAPVGLVPTAATMSLAHEGVQLEFDFDENHQATESIQE